MAAIEKYRQFHGKEPRRVTAKRFHVPEELVYLGRAVAIEYECSKNNGGGDGTKAVYRHRFETHAILCMDSKAKGQLYILGSKLAVNSRGIVR